MAARVPPPKSSSSSPPSSSRGSGSGSGAGMAVSSIDALLAQYVKTISPGQTVTFTLVKGPTSISSDAASAAAAAASSASGAGGGAGGAEGSEKKEGGDHMNGVSSAMGDGGGAGGGGGVGNNANSAESGTNGTSGAATINGGPLPFPRMAKFPISVVSPSFTGIRAADGKSIAKPKQTRMYEEDVPEAKDESDEDEEEDGTGMDGGGGGEGDGANPNSAKGTMFDMGPENPEGGAFGGAAGGGEGTAAAARKKKKRRKWRANEPPQRRWVLEPEDEFIASMVNKAAATTKRGQLQAIQKERILSRYEGVPENNLSQYVLLSVHPNAANLAAAPGTGGMVNGSSKNKLFLSVSPVSGFHAFQQPSKVHTLTMSEAERAITDQRRTMTRYMMHARSDGGTALSGGHKAASMAAAAAALASQPGASKKMTRARLLGRVQAKDSKSAVDDDDDIMGDVTFQNSRKRSGRARQELLTSLGDGVTVDDDGVLGGANDAVFGGKRAFGRMAAPAGKGSAADGEDARRKKKKGGGGDDGGEKGSATMDGMAMGDDFYQRDVGAEYDDLDYDANEQFDDDEIDQFEQELSPGGFGGTGGHSDDEDVDDDDDEGGPSSGAGSGDGGGSGGLATSAGLKLMMARHRGEIDENAPVAPGTDTTKKGKNTAYSRETPVPDGIGGGPGKEGAKKDPRTAIPGGGMAPPGVLPTVGGSSPADDEPPQRKNNRAGKNLDDDIGGARLDENGNRIISLPAVRGEIWLHHGQIKMKRLMKIFNITKKSTPRERQNQFRDVIKELCTMKQTVEGNFLVLKQHYANK